MKVALNSPNRLPSNYSVWDVMQCLYRSEINCGMASFWDGGFCVWLGDDINGKVSESQFLDEEFHLIASWLHQEAVMFFPNSTFAAFNPKSTIEYGGNR